MSLPKFIGVHDQTLQHCTIIIIIIVIGMAKKCGHHLYYDVLFSNALRTMYAAREFAEQKPEKLYNLKKKCIIHDAMRSTMLNGT
jgi:hypothetical protein